MSKGTTASWLMTLRGRRPWTKEEALRVIGAWEASGDSVPRFARDTGFVPQRVYWWLGRLGRGSAQGGAMTARVEAEPTPRFLPMVVRAAPAVRNAGTVTVVASNGLRIEVVELDATSAAWVAALVNALGETAA